MNTMPMHGGSAMPMAWPETSGPAWLAAPVTFIGMWTAMMAAMMLPSLAPTLRCYYRTIARASVRHAGWKTVMLAIGYIGVWAVIGVVVFSLGAALAAAEAWQPALLRAVPSSAAIVVVGAGASQFTSWKSRHLAWCRAAAPHEHSARGDAATAWRRGVRLGVHCSQSCGGVTAALLALGVMDLRAMAIATAAITAERLAPAGARVERATGALGVGAGLVLLARATGVA
jgi:predicted metal-binding membrane protein